MKKINTTRKALIFSAHPDDHLCAAGTLMMLKDKGFIIEEIVATGGEKGTWWVSETERKSNVNKENLKKERKKEIGRASKIIGISETVFLGLKDSEIVREFKLVEKIVGIIRKNKPEIVFTMNPKDYHYDHIKLAEIVIEGIERAAWSCQPELGESWKVPMTLYVEGFYLGKSDVVVDVTSYLEKKKEVIDVYKSQIFPSERRLLESINSYRAFFRRDEKVFSAESFEIPDNFPIYLNRIIEIFK